MNSVIIFTTSTHINCVKIHENYCLFSSIYITQRYIITDARSVAESSIVDGSLSVYNSSSSSSGSAFQATPTPQASDGAGHSHNGDEGHHQAPSSENRTDALFVESLLRLSLNLFIISPEDMHSAFAELGMYEIVMRFVQQVVVKGQ